jgi:hypothetical protein
MASGKRRKNDDDGIRRKRNIATASATEAAINTRSRRVAFTSKSKETKITQMLMETRSWWTLKTTMLRSMDKRKLVGKTNNLANMG